MSGVHGELYRTHVMYPAVPLCPVWTLEEWSQELPCLSGAYQNDGSVQKCRMKSDEVTMCFLTEIK